ncbi:MAG: cell wall hydrolase [Lachnospiraceae bacterium]|nr:cell wall hydrolase [Lachnospiraceae bacterium]
MRIKGKKIILIIYSVLIICTIARAKAAVIDEPEADECSVYFVNSIKSLGHNKGYDVGEAVTAEVELIDAVMAQTLIQQNSERLIESSVKAHKPKPVVETIDGLVINRRDAIKLSEKDKKILYRIVESEAGGENLSGKMLVANVVLNRYLSKKFPNTIKGVVFAHSGGTYQFSPISDGRYYSVHVSSETKRAVKKALSGIDNSRGAVYFMCRRLAKSSNTTWFDNCLDYLFKYGCHEFFK